MSASESAGDMNMVDLITSGDENGKSSDSFEFSSSLKSTTNLINHLATDKRPGHRDRHNKLVGVTKGGFELGLSIPTTPCMHRPLYDGWSTPINRFW